MLNWLALFLGVLVAGCGSDGDEAAVAGTGAQGGGSSSSGGNSSSGGMPDAPLPGVSSDCGSVRMTHYGATDRRWCGFDRTHEVLPDFVRAGMTVAIAEPYNGGSYEGEPGEACGECWELTTGFATQLVMVHDLCPIEGNPICAGSHFHFDVSNEVASVVDGGGWLGEAAVRRVPCPVSGNIHVFVTARNQYGYMQVAFFNHRFPIRLVEYRPVGSEEWLPMERCLARWCEADDMETFADQGPGGVFRFTSGSGEVVEGTEVLTTATGENASFDTGAQFEPAEAEGAACVFVPPGDAYDDEWGGIDGVRWEPNTWGATQMSETSSGCADASASCIRLANFAGSGLHVTYRHVFPVTTFSTLSVSLRAESGGGKVEVAPRSEDARCANPTSVAVGDEWVEVEVDVASSCPDTTEIHGLTISRPTAAMDLLVDKVSYQ